MFNASFGVGQAIGPVLGTLGYQFLGFRATVLLVAGLLFLFAMMYIICAEGCQSFSEMRRNLNNRAKDLAKTLKVKYHYIASISDKDEKVLLYS